MLCGVFQSNAATRKLYDLAAAANEIRIPDRPL